MPHLFKISGVLGPFTDVFSANLRTPFRMLFGMLCHMMFDCSSFRSEIKKTLECYLLDNFILVLESFHIFLGLLYCYVSLLFIIVVGWFYLVCGFFFGRSYQLQQLWKTFLSTQILFLSANVKYDLQDLRLLIELLHI